MKKGSLRRAGNRPRTLSAGNVITLRMPVCPAVPIWPLASRCHPVRVAENRANLQHAFGPVKATRLDRGPQDCKRVKPVPSDSPRGKWVGRRDSISRTLLWLRDSFVSRLTLLDRGSNIWLVLALAPGVKHECTNCIAEFHTCGNAAALC